MGGIAYVNSLILNITIRISDNDSGSLSNSTIPRRHSTQRWFLFDFSSFSSWYFIQKRCCVVVTITNVQVQKYVVKIVIAILAAEED